MVMSAKTPGLIVGQGDPGRTKNRREQLAVFPPLISPRASLMSYDDSESSILFGPGGAMFLPTDPSAGAQPLQPLKQPQGLQASLSTVAASSSLVFQLQSLTSSVSSDIVSQLSATLSPSATNALLTDAPSQTLTTAPSPITTAQTQTSNELNSNSQTQSKSVSESQTRGGFVAASAPSSTSNGVTSATTTSSFFPSLTTSQALSPPSSTSTLQRDFESLPRVAEIVIGVVGAISLIAFLATLGSWIYKQRHRETEHAEITSITSFDNSPRRGFFSRLSKRSGRHTDDMSELGFGLGRVTFFSEPNSGNEHHHTGLTQGAEHAMLEEINEGNRTKDSFLSLRDPFSDKFGVDLVDRGSSTVRPLPMHLHESGTVGGISSVSISPYQHLDTSTALGGSSATPLTVANFAPGDASSDEARHSAAFLAPSSVTRYPSVGTPRIGVSEPRFMSLVEDKGLTVPWAPLNIRRNELQSIREDGECRDRRDDERAQAQDIGFEQLQISPTSTLSLGMFRTFSQRLDHSLSKTMDWHDGVGRPPPGTFRAAWDAQSSAEADTAMNGTEKNWATTLKNNFYNALTAVGSSIHVASSGNRHVDLENPQKNSSLQDKTYVPYKGHIEMTNDPLEDILTPPPTKVAAARLGRTKGSILRGNLGITPGGGVEHGTGLGLGLESLSRSSTLSTCWSETEKAPTEETIRRVRMRVRGLSRDGRMVQRSDTSSTASSMAHPVSRHVSKSSRGRPGISGRSMKLPSQRPRYSRMPVSQSSIWSSTSFASTNGGEERR